MELKILDYLCDHNGFAEYGAILNTFPDILETSGFLQLLRDEGYISGSLDSYSVVSVTKKGRAYRSKLADDMKLIHHILAHSGILDQSLREHDSMYFHIIRCGQ